MQQQLIIYPPADADFEGEFRDAPELEDLAHALIGQHSEIAFLREWNIRVLWKREGPAAGPGKETAGRCKALSGELAYFAASDWLIWLAADACRFAQLSPREIEALLFHELLHCCLKGKDEIRPGTRGHDFEGFVLEVERYGEWSQELKGAGRAFRQLTLFDPETGELA